ncbi:MAG: ADP-ribosylglycohydrolase family protein [Chloroflexia bacterium]
MTKHAIASTKAIGALLGVAIGDALGWPNERPRSRADSPKGGGTASSEAVFESWSRFAGGRFWNHLEEIEAGSYSDDTQLVLATARSVLLERQWFTYLCNQELPAWLLYERGGGRATLVAARSWQRGIPPWQASNRGANYAQEYFQAGGNGVAMRIIPHALLRSQTPQSLYRQILMNGIATHGHPRALVGALLYGFAASYVIQLEQSLEYGGILDYLETSLSLWSKVPQPEDVSANWIDAAHRYANGSYESVWEETIRGDSGWTRSL